MDHPRRLEGDLGERLRGPDRQRLGEVSGVAHGRAIVESQAHEHRHFPQVETEQAAREATGAHPYGRYLEEFEVGAVYKHWPAKTVTEADDHLFCLLTMNHHPLHINDVYAKQSQQGRNVVVGPLVYSLALGMSVSDVSGKAIANLATEELKHPAPVFHGDTLFCESEVLEVKPSRSKPDRGTVRVHTRVLNQDGVLVAEFKRLVLVPRREAGAAGRRGRGRVALSSAPSRRRLVAAVPLAAVAFVPAKLATRRSPGCGSARAWPSAPRRLSVSADAPAASAPAVTTDTAAAIAQRPWRRRRRRGGRGGGSGLSRIRNSTSSNRSGSMPGS